jgi:hypothetical protein
MAITFRAFNVCPSCLQQTIEKGPPTEDTAITSFRVQDPFLADFTDLSRRLIPAARVLPTALPKINSALAVGTPVVRSSVKLNQNTTKLFNGLNTLVQDPNTLLALRDLHDTISVTGPLVNYVAPYQTVCNYATYFFTGLSGDVGFDTGNGTAQAGLLMADTPGTNQANTMQTMGARPADVPTNVNPYTAKNNGGGDLNVLHTQAYGPAIDARGRADCAAGQTGYPAGPFNGPAGANPPPWFFPTSVQNPNSYGSGNDQQISEFDKNHAGTSRTVNWPIPPILYGPTFTGVKNLKDVP